MTSRLTEAELSELERLEREAAWPAPWVAHTFEVDCPCPNGEHCGDSHTCEEVEAPEAYPASAQDPAPTGEGQCIVQISVPGLESLAGPNAQFIAAARNALPKLLRELRARRGSSGQIPSSQQHLIRAEAAHGRVREALASLAESIRQAQVAITDEENP